MKNKTNNTSAFSIFGAASATSANGNSSKSNSTATSSVDITVDIASLIEKGKKLLSDEFLNSSSGKLKSFQALGKEFLRNNPNLSEQFEKATNLSGTYKIIDSASPEIGKKTNEELSHKYAFEAVQRGIDFLEMLK